MNPNVIKSIFITLFSINIAFIFFYNYALDDNTKNLYQLNTLSDESADGSTEVFYEKQGEYKFVDSAMAQEILKQLDADEPYYGSWGKEKSEKKHQKSYMGLSADVHYCEKHRAFFANNPNYIFTQKNIMTSFGRGTQPRKHAISKAGDDIMKEVGSHQRKEISKKFDIELKPEVMAFYTELDMFIYRQIDQQFSCLGQMSNHIPGHSSLYRKDMAVKSVNNYIKSFESRPQCFSFDKFFPKTYLLYEEEECQEFFKIIETQKYKELKKERNIVFMRKVGSGKHQGAGVFPMDNKEEQYLRDLYKNGGKCGKLNKNYMVQNFVHNPLLIKGRKFDFRMYMLIASTNPMIAFYHDGCLRVSLNLYKPESGNKTNLLTNTALSKAIFRKAAENGTYLGKTVQEWKEEHSWTFPRLQEYLLEAGLIQDPQWLDNYLRPEFKEAMIHLVRMAQYNFFKQSSLYEVYGLDFMLDDNMNLWFIEGNVRPFLIGHTPDNKKLKMGMLKDHFEIIFSIIRSRMKRVIHYVNNMILNGRAKKNEDGKIEIPNLEERRKEFKEIIKNFIDPEFAISPGNGFSKIIDENYSGIERYAGFIPEECF